MKNIGMLLLAVYLILVGLKSIIAFSFTYDYMVLGILAIVAGVLLILKK